MHRCISRAGSAEALCSFALYIVFFPQLIAGPIERYDDVEAALAQPATSFAALAQGVRLFVIGLGKKLLLANPMGEIWERLAPAAQQNGALGSWLALAAFAERTGLPFFFLPVPAAGAMSKEAPYLPYPDAALMALLLQQESVTVLDVSEKLKEGEQAYYYATDPHWNAQGVYRAYRAIAPALGFAPLKEDAFSATESSGFYGTCYTRAALWHLLADTLTLLDSGVPVQVTLDGAETYDSLFFPSHLASGDQYPVFLDGNHGLTQIENLAAPDAPNLLILKDSFANSLVPLLVPHYHTITMVDLRAYRGEVSALVQEGNYEAMLSVYSLTRLSEDTNLAWLH